MHLPWTDCLRTAFCLSFCNLGEGMLHKDFRRDGESHTLTKRFLPSSVVIVGARPQRPPGPRPRRRRTETAAFGFRSAGSVQSQRGLADTSSMRQRPVTGRCLSASGCVNLGFGRLHLNCWIHLINNTSQKLWLVQPFFSEPICYPRLRGK